MVGRRTLSEIDLHSTLRISDTYQGLVFEEMFFLKMKSPNVAFELTYYCTYNDVQMGRANDCEYQSAETEEAVIAYLDKDGMCNKWIRPPRGTTTYDVVIHRDTYLLLLQMTKTKESHKIDFNLVASMVNNLRNKQGLEIQHMECLDLFYPQRQQ